MVTELVKLQARVAYVMPGLTAAGSRVGKLAPSSRVRLAVLRGQLNNRINALQSRPG